MSMLGQAIGGVLASAVGVALSPVPIIAVILVLGTPKARSNGPAFALGWVCGLVVVSVVVLLLASGASNPSSGSSTAVNAIKLALGAVFLFMAAAQWQKRPREGEQATLPKWMQTLDAFTPAKSVGLGALLSAANPKNLALTIAAAGSIAQVGLDAGQSAVAVAVFVVLGSVTVAGPVVFYMMATKAAEGPLSEISRFMADHNAVIMGVVLLVLGAKLVGDGIAGLST
jgi:threonine/homoserine/homoserine lactone efflux protein